MPEPFPLRFAILRHEGIPTPHYDLMFETSPGSDLATWRSPTWPLTQTTAVTRLPDHRPLYLTYQGPLTNNRGHITRIAAGQCHLNRNLPTGLAASAASAMPHDLSFHFSFPDNTSLLFTASPPDQWTATPQPKENPQQNHQSHGPP